MIDLELSLHFVRATKLNYEFYPAMTAGHFAGYANYTNYADFNTNNPINPLNQRHVMRQRRISLRTKISKQ